MKIKMLDVFKENIGKIGNKVKLSSKIGRKVLSPEEVQEEIQINRNHSWFRETFRDNEFAENAIYDLENGMSKELFKAKYKKKDYVQFKYFVDNDISYLDFVYESFQVAKALKAQGFKDGDEIFAFVDRSPEYAYILGAANILGAQVNICSEKFSHEYIKDGIIYYWDDRLTPEQINEAKSLGLVPRGQDYINYLESVGLEPINSKKFVFYTDVKHNKLKDVVKDLHEAQFISVPYDRSLKHRVSYVTHGEKFYKKDEPTYSSKNIMEFDSLLNDRHKYIGRVEEESNLDTPFTVSYSSGTTGNPKGIRHSNRHYITMARYHDTEVSGIPSVGNMSTYINIPAYSNSFISSGLSDNVIKGGLLMLDPIDDSEYFKTGLKVNDANMNIGSVSLFVKMALRSFNHPEEFEDYTLKNSIFNFVAGEELLPGEEKIINKFLKKVKAGTDISFGGKNLKLPLPVVKVSLAGGSCEIGSGFLAIMRDYASKLPRYSKKDPVGMTAYKCYDIKVLREDGTYAEPYEIGKITVNSDCTMLGYNHDKKATEEFYTYDAYGNKRADMKVWGYLDEKGRLTMKDRIEKNVGQLGFRISDAVTKDTENICSAKVVRSENGEFVVFVIYQPDMKISKEEAEELIKSLVLCGTDVPVRVIEVDPDSYYPLTKSLKVDKKALADQANEHIRENENNKTLVKNI